MGPGKKPPRLPSLPGPVLQPLARGREVVIPCPTLGARKENKSGAQAQPLELKEGQTQRPGRRVQQPPRPLRECSRGEEKPAKLPVNGSSYLPTPLRSSQGTRSDVEQRSEERPRPGAPGVRYGGSGFVFPPTCWGGGGGKEQRAQAQKRLSYDSHSPSLRVHGLRQVPKRLRAALRGLGCGCRASYRKCLGRLWGDEVA